MKRMIIAVFFIFGVCGIINASGYISFGNTFGDDNVTFEIESCSIYNMTQEGPCAWYRIMVIPEIKDRDVVNSSCHVVFNGASYYPENNEIRIECPGPTYDFMITLVYSIQKGNKLEEKKIVLDLYPDSEPHGSHHNGILLEK